MNSINPVGPLKQSGGLAPLQNGNVQKSSEKGQDFKSTLAGFLSDVNQMQSKADESIDKLVAGEITDVHQVMNTAQEANLAFNMMMEIRNKVVDAYQELMRLRF